MKIYLAGPDVFLPDAILIGRRKVELCRSYGHIGLFPLDNEIDSQEPDASLQIYRGNEAMMEEAEAIIANLTPFRGPSADVGTVYELGYMAGRSKLCLGYSNDPDMYSERVAKRGQLHPKEGKLYDKDGFAVESFSQKDNLMITHGLDVHGYSIVVQTQRSNDIWRDLRAFETCLELIAKHSILLNRQTIEGGR